MDIKLELDLSELKSLIEEVKGFEAKVSEAASGLAAMTHAHVVEEAKSKLKSRQAAFLENLTFEQADKNVWVISILEPAMWIEEGREEGEMIDDLLAEGAKVSRDGHRYKAIPFQHNKGGAATHTAAQSSLAATVKEEMKRLKIPWSKPIRDEKGKVKEGLVAKFDINDRPTKTHHGAGQGHGPIGSVKQGNTGIPFLRGVRIYQKILRNQDGSPKTTKGGSPRVQKGIYTFRMVSDSQKGTGKWVHPGLPPMNFLDEAEKWAEELWDTVIVPDLLKSFK